MLCADRAPEVVDAVDEQSARDEMLLIRYVELRCNDSFTELYDRYFPLVFRHLRKFIPIAKECEDLIQDTFTMVSRSEGYERGRSVRNWIIGIADNLAMKAIRNSGRLKRGGEEAIVQFSVLDRDPPNRGGMGVTFDPMDDSADEPAELAMQEDALQKVRDLLETLDPDDRKIIEMAYFQDKTHREIALEMNFASKTTATRRINAILARMKEAMLEPDEVPVS